MCIAVKYCISYIDYRNRNSKLYKKRSNNIVHV